MSFHRELFPVVAAPRLVHRCALCGVPLPFPRQETVARHANEAHAIDGARYMEVATLVHYNAKGSLKLQEKGEEENGKVTFIVYFKTDF